MASFYRPSNEIPPALEIRGDCRRDIRSAAVSMGAAVNPGFELIDSDGNRVEFT
jgi:hypothetical protein